jgi:hypothetical protein
MIINKTVERIKLRHRRVLRWHAVHFNTWPCEAGATHNPKGRPTVAKFRTESTDVLDLVHKRCPRRKLILSHISRLTGFRTAPGLSHQGGAATEPVDHDRWRLLVVAAERPGVCSRVKGDISELCLEDGRLA